MSSHIKNFKNLTKEDVNIAGGKGASLGEMAGAGIPVPPGFVVLASAFDRFLAETDLAQELPARLRKINYRDVASADKASAVIRDLIADRKMPADLEKEITGEFKKLKRRYAAVRSSATAEDSEVASWAGELESYLNTTGKTLLVNVKKCWSSLFTPRAIFYRQENKLVDAYVSVAVVVQAMVASEISGITFTVHPVTEDCNQMIIEAAWGLGEAIVSGAVTPDAYVIDKRDWSIIDISINTQEKMIVRGDVQQANKWVSVPKNRREKQILSKRQIITLAKLCASIEKHYKKPQDIEWAYAGGKFYIVQSRPITTL